jgi:hypothetical protein
VFCVLCGSTFLVYCRHEVSNSLTPAVRAAGSQDKSWMAGLRPP